MKVLVIRNGYGDYGALLFEDLFTHEPTFTTLGELHLFKSGDNRKIIFETDEDGDIIYDKWKFVDTGRYDFSAEFLEFGPVDEKFLEMVRGLMDEDDTKYTNFYVIRK